MCGICVFVYKSGRCVGEPLSFDYIQKQSRLVCRGPDKSHSKEIEASNGRRLYLSGHVLHFRGNQLVPQPATDEVGNQLLWNGEIYNGIDVKPHQSDTTVLLEHLASCESDEHILSIMSRIEGPWSFTYWQASTETLWFGRDVFGRRSLLWHLPMGEGDPLILTSVRVTPWHFLEVPSVGLYKVCLKDSGPGFADHKITVIPWKNAVWPGTLDVVKSNEDFVMRLYPVPGKVILVIELVQLVARLTCPYHLRHLDLRPEDIRCMIKMKKFGYPASGSLGPDVVVKLEQEKNVESHMPEVCRNLPPPDYKLPELEQNQSYLEYLENLSKTNTFLQTLSRQLTSVLVEAVRVRVCNQQKLGYQQRLVDQVSSNKLNDNFSLTETNQTAACEYTVDSTGADDPEQCTHTSNASVAILFSGGIDSTVLAALADRCIPPDEAIDLLNVAFEMKQKDNPTSKKKRPVDLTPDRKWDVPDRQTGYMALSELNPNRMWNFVEVNVTAAELQEARQSCIQYLLHPLHTVLDDSIGCAVWFAARGTGILGNGTFKGSKFVSKARVILCGMGADEQLVGYSRHRVRFKEEGYEGLLNEIQLEITRLSARNLGRDDRIITDHGKESRLPYLDENVVKFLSELPVYQKADLTLPRGLGEKLLLRLSAYELGLIQTSTLPKRAIQFGSRIAKLENSKEKASDTCNRLLQANKDEL